MSATGKPSERATPLTLLTPIRTGAGGWLRLVFWLATHLPLPRWTLLRLRLIHFARWTLLSELPATGRLPRRYLLFESNFNGTPDGYVEAFSYVFPRGMKVIWGSSEGFPGPIPVEGLREWIDLGRLDIPHYYCAYPTASTRQVLSALEVRRRLNEFAVATAGVGPERFASEYQRLVSDLQRAL